MHLSAVHAMDAAAGAAGEASPQLKNAAHEFEAMFLKELLKPLEEHAGFSGGDDDSDDDSGAESSMLEYGTEAMAKSLSEHGGIGIARMVLARLAPLEARRHGGADRAGEGAPAGVAEPKEGLAPRGGRFASGTADRVRG